MRLKSYSSSTMDHAMAMVRQELGEEALIVSCVEDQQGVRLTATLEEPFWCWVQHVTSLFSTPFYKIVQKSHQKFPPFLRA